MQTEKNDHINLYSFVIKTGQKYILCNINNMYYICETILYDNNLR